MATRLILIRHGITRWNKQKRYCGCKDVVLSSAGKKQAAKLRGRLKSVRFDKIYCSDRKRALETSRIIFNGACPIMVKGLREINFGTLEGLCHKEITKKYPTVYRQWLRDPFKNHISKAESLNVFKKRVNSAIKRIVRLNSGKTIALVCHGGTIGIFIAAILKSRDFWRNIPKAASISIVEYRANKPKIKLFNCIEHLK